ncbi:MAG: heavy-metal-associated domain-containing protein, partial [Actinomycetota bacterium]
MKERFEEREVGPPVEDGNGGGDGRVAVYEVEGAGCLDCAGEVEEAIADLPGVEEADFNPVAGRLTVIGEADTEAIRRITKSEGWAVRPQGSRSPNGSV